MTTQQRIDEIMKCFKQEDGYSDDTIAIVKLQLEALVIQAQLELTQLQLEQLKK